MDTKSLIASGFSIVGEDYPRRLLINSQGRERTGKTDWAVRTLPRRDGLMVYIGLDFGHEGVINKYAGDKTLLKWVMNVPPVTTQNDYLQHWTKVKDHIQKAMAHPDVRAIVLDTGTDIWELLRLAEFGALTKSGDTKQLYGQINQHYKSLVKMAYDREINIVVIHKTKKLYSTRKVQTNKGLQDQEYWDGSSYERAGFGEGGYLVQVQIEHLFDISRKGGLDKKFGIRVIDCRQNMDIVGTELWGADNNFATLAQFVFPDSTEADWL